MNTHDPSDPLVFESVDNPGNVPPGYVYVQSVATPMLWCTLPLMIAASTAVLMGRDPLSFVLWGFPLATGAAVAWTIFRLTRRVAKIRIADGHVMVYSIWDQTHNTQPHMGPLLHAERTRFGLRMSVGDTVYTFRKRDWPEFDRLLESLRRHIQ